MTEKVFLTYAIQDSGFARYVSDRIADLLPAKGTDVEVVDVQKTASVGTDMRRSIKQAMDSASRVVIVLTPNSDKSQWVNYEAGMAAALEKPIVLVLRRGDQSSSAIRNKLHGDVQTIEVDDIH